jgi:hypothetical protein
MKGKLYRSFVLILTVGSLAIVVGNGRGISGQGSSTVPAPPEQIADRMGIYAWGFDSSAYQSQTGGQIDRLNWAADKVAGLGSHVIRLTLPGVVYGLPDMGDLAMTAAIPAYDRLFSDPRFKTYLLTTTTTGAFIDTIYPWYDGYTQAEYNATRAEIGRLGDYLLGNPKYAGKTFIILNWESDNEMVLFKTKQSIWDAFTAWIESRADGVRDAHNRNPNSPAKLYSGFEFAYSRALLGGPCGAPVPNPLQESPLKNRCALDYVAPRVSVDYYSYSSWQTVIEKIHDPNLTFKDALRNDLNVALATVRTKRPEIQERNFIIGEFGFPREDYGEKTVANYFNEVIDAVTAPDGFQVSYAVWWQIIDNRTFNLPWGYGYGFYTSRDGLFQQNLVGELFRRRLAGQIVAPPTGGPVLRRSPPGIVNAESGEVDFQLNPNSRIAINAEGPDAPFSESGNRIFIIQNMNYFFLTRDNTQDFSESPTQISASLPRGLRPGGAYVGVMDANGVESRAQPMNFSCAACPVVYEIIDSEKQLNEFHPGTVVTITGGNFSPSGNSVAVEQEDVVGRRYRFVIPPADVMLESPGSIKVRLPRDLIITKFVVVVVSNSDGLESNIYPLRGWPYPGITPDCQTCAPVISAKGGVLGRDNGSTSVPPGGVVTISGDRFSASGNTVIIEQGGERYVVAKDSNWSESPARINLTLPAGLKPGRAQIYVVNAQGRESLVAEIIIPRGLRPSHPPIKRGELRRIE